MDNKLIKITLIVAFILMGIVTFAPNSHASDVPVTMTNDFVFKIAADYNYVKIDDSIVKPEIIRANEITLVEFNKMFHVVNGWNSNAVTNYYFPKENIIVLVMQSGFDSLIHELTHYFQIKYRNYDFTNTIVVEIAEMEAASNQQKYVKEYLNGVK